MYRPKEAIGIAQLQQENAELKLRVQRLERHLDLSSAPQKSAGVHVNDEKRLRFERIDKAGKAVKVLQIIIIMLASFVTLMALYVTIHILVGYVFVVKDFPGQGPTGDFRPISKANYHIYVQGAVITWACAASMWNSLRMVNRMSCRRVL